MKHDDAGKTNSRAGPLPKLNCSEISEANKVKLGMET